MNPRRVQFITLDEDDKDLVISFALGDAQGEVESLILIRTLLYEEFLEEDERGVKVSLENDELEEEHRNVLVEIRIGEREMVIRSTFREYALDI